jgi:hypothetical protein
LPWAPARRGGELGICPSLNIMTMKIKKKQKKEILVYQILISGIRSVFNYFLVLNTPGRSVKLILNGLTVRL